MAFSEGRLAKLRALLAEEQLDALYLRTLSNIAWVTGFEGVFDGEDAHALIVTADACLLHSDSRYVVALEREAAGTPIRIDAERKAHAKALFEVAGECDGLRIGIEDSLSLREFRALEAEAAVHGAQLKELSSAVERLRQVKDAAELSAMRAAQAITDAGFSHIIGYMRTGMTERQVQLELDNFMLSHGADGLAFTTIVASGPHAASPHAIPGETKLEEGHAVVMDFGARYAGYCSDMTRTVFMGRPSDELQRAWATLRRANEECEAYVRAGIVGADVHNLAERILEEGGFGGTMGHSLGHSVGLDIHESPNLAPSNNAPLEAGNVVTVEPGIYLPGRFGMRLEDFGVVTQGGYDVFTASTHEMVIIENR